MKEIEMLCDQIEEEIGDAKKYILCALSEKSTFPNLAQTHFQLSIEEMDHMNRLHKAAVAMIEDYRKEKGEPPADMLAVYNYLHKRSMERAADVKAMQAMYRET